MRVRFLAAVPAAVTAALPAAVTGVPVAVIVAALDLVVLVALLPAVRRPALATGAPAALAAVRAATARPVTVTLTERAAVLALGWMGRRTRDAHHQGRERARKRPLSTAPHELASCDPLSQSLDRAPWCLLTAHVTPPPAVAPFTATIASSCS